jgi:hypothetical protein
MGGFSFIAMYILMYAMVDSFGNVFNNVNQAYMAALMTAPMLLIEIAIMRGMYPNRAINAAIVCGSIVLGVTCWLLIRGQVFVGDEQFLRSMIPHHGGAILMCDKAVFSDPEINGLCARIKDGQQEEIDWMKRKLEELE